MRFFCFVNYFLGIFILSVPLSLQANATIEDDFKSSVMQLEEKVSELHDSSLILGKKSESLSASVVGLEQKISASMAQSTDFLEVVNRLDLQITELNEIVVSAGERQKEDLAVLTDSINSTRNQVLVLAQKIESGEVQDQIQDLSDQFADFKEILDAQVSTAEDLQQKQTALEGRLGKLITDFESSNAAWKQQFIKYDKAMEAIKSSQDIGMGALAAELDVLAKELQGNRSADINQDVSLEDQKKAVQARMNLLLSQLDGLAGKISQIDKRLSSTRQQTSNTARIGIYLGGGAFLLIALLAFWAGRAGRKKGDIKSSYAGKNKNSGSQGDKEDILNWLESKN